MIISIMVLDSYTQQIDLKMISGNHSGVPTLQTPIETQFPFNSPSSFSRGSPLLPFIEAPIP